MIPTAKLDARADARDVGSAMRSILVLVCLALLSLSCSIPTRVTIENRTGEDFVVELYGRRSTIPAAGETRVEVGMEGGAFSLRSSTGVRAYSFSTHDVLGTPFRSCSWGVCIRVRVDSDWRIHLVPSEGEEAQPQPAGFPLEPKRSPLPD